MTAIKDEKRQCRVIEVASPAQARKDRRLRHRTILLPDAFQHGLIVLEW